MTVASQPEFIEATSLSGLSQDEVKTRRVRGQVNRTPNQQSRSYLQILVQNTFTFIHVVLFVIAFFLILLGLPGDALVTAGLVVANITVGVVQEMRAKRKLDRIALILRPEATVIRDGRQQTIHEEEIVEGDLLLVQSGDQFLADGIIVGDGTVNVDESLITGEADLIPKRAGDSVYSGSFCMVGSAAYIAENVGADSTAQQMTAGARQFRSVTTPLQRQVSLVIQAMIVGAIVLGLIVIVAYRSVELEMPVAESVRAAAVIFGLVPQGLIFLVTLTYTLAAVRLAGSGALIQRMNAVESLSHVDLLCLDKTGTLTTNRLTLNAVSPSGIDESELRQRLADFSASVSAGNRTIKAITDASPAEGRSVHEEVPFSSARKWSALSFDDDSLRGTFVLGAPEMIEPSLRSAPDHHEQASEWEHQGLRVLLFAYVPEVVSLHDDRGEPRLPDNLIPLGLVSLRDELRPEAADTLRHFASAGVELKIISGDHPHTVAALARQAGFEHHDRVISGTDLDRLNDLEFADVADNVSIFGRIAPQQKERLVKTLRSQGRYVAMIGDGVNDVLALKQAQVAIALRSGSQVTRSTADMVLMDDSFAVLPKALLEGQRILNGMQDVLRLFLVRGSYIASIILICALLGVQFPSTPKLETVLALLTVGIPTFALAAWAEPGTAARNMLRASLPFVLPASLTIALVSLGVYLGFLSTSDETMLARTALYTTATLCGAGLILFLRPPIHRNIRPTLLAAGMLLLYGLIVAVEPLRTFFELDVLQPGAYVLIAVSAVLWALLFYRLRLTTLVQKL